VSAQSQYHEDHMKPVKEYLVSDLFYTRWDRLTQLGHAEVFALQQKIKTIDRDTAAGSMEYGITLIAILQRVNKNPHLVGRINEAQAVDIYNDLKFLNEPWYFFPEIGERWIRPDDEMARHTFDQFIYADNEFTSYLVTQDEKYLKRLAVTLYLKVEGLIIRKPVPFDKENVERHADLIKLRPHQLQLIFYTYAHVRESVVNRCKTLFHKLPAVEGVASTLQVNSGPMWQEIKNQVAMTLVFGNFDELGRTNMHSVVDHLEFLAKRNVK
jgi:hypothetical protein